MNFSSAPPAVMHIDLNSCFATVEQQANPLLRGKPVVVAAYTTLRGCILAASVEAKRFGVRTGMRVKDGQALCPNLVVLPSDPDKYRFINHQLLTLLTSYSDKIGVKSIDEMVVKMNIESIKSYDTQKTVSLMIAMAKEIKERIRKEIGEWLTVSIGIAPNSFLAKTASNLHKPDGLDVIHSNNILEVMKNLQLENLCGIKSGYGARLRSCGITTALAFYLSSKETLKSAFRSVIGYHWWFKLHGFETETCFPSNQTDPKSIGHSYALYKPYVPTDHQAQQILCQLIQKVGWRLRNGGFTTRGVHLSCLYTDHSFWHHGQKLPGPIYANDDLYQSGLGLLKKALNKPIRALVVSCFNLQKNLYAQGSLLDSQTKKEKLIRALDEINRRWGRSAIMPGKMLAMEQRVLDRIAFGQTVSSFE